MNNPPLPQSVLAAPAVHPPTREMMLQSKFLPWVVRVVAEGPFVTVADVLAALYRELRHRITKREWEAAGSSRSVQRAYEARCEVDPSERPKGIKRIDFLLGQTVVEALVRTKDGTWHIESHA
ncbi:hypothetical protein BV25DRAFT_1801507 [Artomyces pyxidatus]|uniref:Uncharacterized protein n=1 Tax=Artomyces pyxidatus TaxID=48021 RepID=A0ACB8T4V5_9AGAM|nr:hypothetical protein BV25DRAFT_1801507 [Artomyces pyxidatus]